MNNEKAKYANGMPLDASKMSHEEKRRAIQYWCEGNQELKRMLLYCNDRDIETVGCCSGHKEEYGYAYIGIKLGNQQDNEVIDLLAKLEINNTDMTMAFIRSQIDRCFVVLTAPTIGNNENFFENINLCWNQNIQKDAKFHKVRKKYEMLKTLVTDKRLQEYSESAEISFGMRDKHVRAVDMFEYDGRILNMPMSEIERIGQWLIDNPNAKISKECLGEDAKNIIYPIKDIKEKCRMSKIFFSMIKNAYVSIKNVISKSNGKIKFSEEGVR